ncbi:MAG: ATP-binding protein [Anaerolineales bacterium]|jgi:serine/threonine-protein kinase RsbW
MVSKNFDGNFSSLEKICKFVTKEAKEAGLNDDSIYAVQLAVDEACTNIIEHAYHEKENGKINCECNIINDGLEIILKDNGMPFNPDLIPEPQIGVPLRELKMRGAGLYLIKKVMDDVVFQFDEHDGSILKMMKKRSG